MKKLYIAICLLFIFTLSASAQIKLGEVPGNTTTVTDSTSEDNSYLLRVAGEDLVTGNFCYQKSDGKYWKTDASAEATSIGRILLCIATIATDATGLFLEEGDYTTTGLTTADEMFLSETEAAMTNTIPTTTSAIIRFLGTCESTTVFHFSPDNTWSTVK